MREGDNARAALVAIVAATGGTEAGLILCALLLDAAAQTLMTAPSETIASIGSADPIDRMAATGVLSELCAACRLCPRGEALASEAADRGALPRRWRR